MTGSDDRQLSEDKVYVMSQTTLERFCKKAAQRSIKAKKQTHHNKKSCEHSAVSESVSDVTTAPVLSDVSRRISEISERTDRYQSVSEEDYSLVFEPESRAGSVQEVVKSSEGGVEICDDKIVDEIVVLSDKSSTKPIEELILKELEVPEDLEEPPSEPSTEKPSQKLVQSETSDKITEISEEVDVENSVSKEQETVLSSLKTDQEKNQTARGDLETQTELSLVEDSSPQIVSNEIGKPEKSRESLSEEIVTHSTIQKKSEAEVLKLTSCIEKTDTQGSQELIVVGGSDPKQIDSVSEETSKLTLNELESSVQDKLDTNKDTGTKEKCQETESEQYDDESLTEALEVASKIEESLTKINQKFSSESEEIGTESGQTESSVEELKLAEDLAISAGEIKSVAVSEIQNVTNEDSTATEEEIEDSNEEKTSEKPIDVKKRVAEIMAEAQISKPSDNGSRLQDIYVTAFDINPSILAEAAGKFYGLLKIWEYAKMTFTIYQKFN